MHGEVWGLVEMVADRVARRVMRRGLRCGSPGLFDYDDLRQEARIAMWRAYGKFRPGRAPLDAYLLMVAKRRMANLWRDRRSFLAPFGMTGAPHTLRVGALPDQPDDRAATGAAALALDVETALDRIPAQAREVFLLSTTGHCYRDCATMLGVSPATVGRLRREAMVAVQRELVAS
jgi:RNA polymerase sigma factor (sigma-70 family)